MASSSAHDAKTNPKRLRQRNEHIAYSMPGPAASKFIICDSHGPPLESGQVPLARTLVLFDIRLVHRVQRHHQKNASSTDATRKAEADRWIADCNDIRQQWKEIDSGQCQFSELYMKSNTLIPIWTEGMRIIKEVLRSKRISRDQTLKRDAFARIVVEYESQADILQTQMLDTARRGLFDPEILSPIQERWMRLDETVKLHYDLCNSYLDDDVFFASRKSLTWPEVRNLLQVNDEGTKGDDKLSQKQAAGRPQKAAVLPQTAEPKVANMFILWLVVFSCAVAPAALFALGYSRSLHLQGTTNDADFWFLIQAILVQVQGLVVSALLERRRDRLPTWRWAIPAAVAAVCSIVAIPLYVTVPNEWSSFLSLVAGTTQSFMMLQLFLF